MFREWLEENHKKLMLEDETAVRQSLMNVASRDPDVSNLHIGYERYADGIGVYIGWKNLKDEDPRAIHTYEVKALY